MADWNMRDEVAEELAELHGWREDPGTPGTFFRRNATWAIVDASGKSVLTVTGTQKDPGYAIPFVMSVPSYLIVQACREATADCPRCGTLCEGDCGEPDGVASGTDGDGMVYSEIR